MPIRSDVHIDTALTAFAVELRNLKFVADQLFPVVPVVKESDKYFIFNSREQLKDYDTIRAIGAPALEFEWGSTSNSYTAEEYAVRHLLADRIVNNSDAPIRPRMRTVQKLVDVLSLGQEKRIAALVTGGTQGISTANPTIQWDLTNATIEADIDLAKQTIGKNAGVVANTMLMNTEVKDAFKKDSTIRNLIRYTIAGNGGTELLVNGELPPIIFNLRPIIAEAVEDTAKRGQTASISRIWSDDVVIAYVEPNPDVQAVSLGYIFRVNALVVKSYRVEERGGEMIEPSMIQDECVVAKQAGYLIDNVLS